MEDMKNTNTVSLEELEFQRIKRHIEYTNSEKELKRITIFNPTDEEVDELATLGMKYSEIEDGEIKKINMPPNILIKEILNKFTDINLPEDQESIDRIINKPNMILKEVMLEISDIYLRVMNLLKKAIEYSDTVKELTGISDTKLIQLVETQKEIQELTALAEKEKQETEKIKAQNNEEEVRRLAQELHAEKTKNLELQVKFEENEVQPEKKKRGRKLGSKNKVKEDIIVEETNKIVGDNIG